MHETLKHDDSDPVLLQQVESVESGRQEFCTVHQLHESGLHVLSGERERVKT